MTRDVRRGGGTKDVLYEVADVGVPGGVDISSVEEVVVSVSATSLSSRSPAY